MNFDKTIEEIENLLNNSKVSDIDKNSMLNDILNDIYSEGYKDGSCIGYDEG